MALTSGTRIGVYQIGALIGEGGMGQVWRARDTRLNRDVALKVLPDSFAGDADRLARFTREAQALASLNHPNIAAIHGLEESGDVRALVMELVEGDDLSQRIARGAIPIDEALPIAKQIADALEAAHEQGIIHRDLKPANIKVRTDGTVKVLDFGLAKAMEPASAHGAPAGRGHPSMSPTITTPAMTEAGMILGTAAYMSPEQARGKTVDRRADIWAFGAVLFEMLTGRRAFGGDDVAETLANVINREPAWATLPSTVPTHVRQTLHLCLRKPLRERVTDMGAVRLALEGAFESAVPQPSAVPQRASGGRMVWMALAAAAALAAAMAPSTVRHLREASPPPPPETRLDIVTPATDEPTSFALSPDGRQIVFAATGEGESRLWLRSLATTTAQPLAGTEGAVYPFWSPDGRSIGFFAGHALKRLDLGGGAPQTLAPVTAGRGGTWNADGVIVLAASLTTPLERVAASGGAAAAMTTLGAQQQAHVTPSFLPDGQRFLFYAVGTPDTSGIYLGALDGRAPVRLTPADSRGWYLPSGGGGAGAPRDGGWLLWVRTGTRTLVGQRVDLPNAALTGAPVTLADGVPGDAFGSAAVSVATTGLMAYRAGEASQRQLTWVDRSGSARGTVGDSDPTQRDPRVSPDGRRVILTRTVQGNSDLWLLDGPRTSRLTFDVAIDRYAIWSPDGTRIVFRSQRTGAGDLYQKGMSGAGAEERVVVTSDQIKTPLSWSPDGRYLLYAGQGPQTNLNLWVVPMVGDRTPFVFLKTPYRKAWTAFSPDGRWVAYTSNESGRMEVYVRPFVPPSPAASGDKPGAAGTAAGAAVGQWQVSTAGGTAPLWRPDGKELYYLNPAGAMMAAGITVTGVTLAPGAPVVLFPTKIVGGGEDNQQGRQYDVAPDGRFLINTMLDRATAPITLLMNWNPDAKK